MIPGLRRPVLLTGVATLLATFLLASVPSPASAHASLVSSSPAQGARLDALPSEVTFEFSEEIATPAYVIVTDPEGEKIADGEPTVADTTVTQELTDGPDGNYTMAYRVSSADGHPVSGEVAFTVGEASTVDEEGAVDDEGADEGSATGDGETDADGAARSGEAQDSVAGSETGTDDGPAATASAEPAESPWQRRTLAITVAVLLFSGSAILFWLARRTPTDHS